MQHNNKPIGVFDSGIGGLTVLRRLTQRLPDERFVYLGDTARVPYGNKSAETVKQYSLQCARFLLQHDVKLMVVACNTASALALDVLQSEFDIPVVGVISGAALAASNATSNHHIGVIGTRATIASESYKNEIIRCGELKGARHSVHSRACPLFVPLVEEGWLDAPATRLIAEEYLRPLIANGIDTLVLGCTHYPLLSPLLASILPDVQLIDCGESAAADVMRLNTQPASKVSEPTKTSVYVTDHSPSFSILANQFLGRQTDEPVLVTIDSLVQSQGASRLV